MKYLVFIVLSICGCNLFSATKPSNSFYPQKPEDTQAVYFTPENFGITADGKTDVSDQLQKAINQVKTDLNFGILFIPEGFEFLNAQQALSLEERMAKHCLLQAKPHFLKPM
jgi:hypothetical protein